MEQKNNLGLVAMIVGIAGLVLTCLGGVGIWAPIVGMVAGIVAIVLGVKARKANGGGMATAGLVTGIIATVLGGIVTICVACTLCAAGAIYNAAQNGELSSALNELSSALQ